MTEDEVKRRAAFAELARLLGEDCDRFAMEQAVLARYQKARFDAYVKAGFTPEQAIQLCK